MELHEFALGGESVEVVAEILPVNLGAGVDSVDVLLDVGVSVAVDVAVGVRGVIGIETVRYFPCVGHTVAVGVDIGSAFIFGISAHLHGVGDDTEFVGILGKAAVFE